MSVPPAPPPPSLRRYRELQPLPPRSSARRDFFNDQGVSQAERGPYPEYRYTKYFWTINSQRAAYTRDQAVVLKDVLAKAVLDVFISGVTVAFAHPNHEFNRIYIGENVLQLAVEVGPKDSKIHLHMIQNLVHRSFINIDPQDVKEKIEEKIRQRLGYELPIYVNKMSHGTDDKRLEAYLDKGRIDWGQEGRNPHGIWTYSWNNAGGRDWTCSHPVEVVYGEAAEIGSGFIGHIDDDDDYEPPAPPEPAPALPVRRQRQPEYVQLIPAQNLTPANRIRTANTPLAPAPQPPQVLRGRARELNELLESSSNFLAANRRGRGNGRGR